MASSEGSMDDSSEYSCDNTVISLSIADQILELSQYRSQKTHDNVIAFQQGLFLKISNSRARCQMDLHSEKDEDKIPICQILSFDPENEDFGDEVDHDILDLIVAVIKDEAYCEIRASSFWFSVTDLIDLNDLDDLDPFKTECNILLEARQKSLQFHNFENGEFVTWKPFAKPGWLYFPGKSQACVVIKTLTKPVIKGKGLLDFDNELGEFDLVIAYHIQNGNHPKIVTSLVPSRLFEPFNTDQLST